MYFAKDSSGKWGYKVGGAGSVTPFKSQADIDNAKNSVTLSVSGRTVTASNGKSVTIPYGGSSGNGTATITTKEDNGTETFDIADGYISKIVVVHFKAYIKVLFNKRGQYSNTNTVTISNGSTSYSITNSSNLNDFGNGYYTFTVTKQGNWTVTDTSLSKTINVNSNGTTYTVDITYLDLNSSLMDNTHNYIQYKNSAASNRFIVLIPENNRKLRCVLGGTGVYSCTYTEACAKVWSEATLVINSTPTTFTNIRIPTYDLFNSCGNLSSIRYYVKDFYYFWTSTKIDSTSAYVYQISSNIYVDGDINDSSSTYSAIPMIVYQVHQ